MAISWFRNSPSVIGACTIATVNSLLIMGKIIERAELSDAKSLFETLSRQVSRTRFHGWRIQGLLANS